MLAATAKKSTASSFSFPAQKYAHLILLHSEEDWKDKAVP